MICVYVYLCLISSSSYSRRRSAPAAKHNPCARYQILFLVRGSIFLLARYVSEGFVCVRVTIKLRDTQCIIEIALRLRCSGAYQTHMNGTCTRAAYDAVAILLLLIGFIELSRLFCEGGDSGKRCMQYEYGVNQVLSEDVGARW